MADNDIWVRIRGEAAHRVRQHKMENGADFTFTVNAALLAFFERLDKMREQRYTGIYTTANAPKGEGE